MVLIVIYVPEGCVAGVRDVACKRTFRWMLLVRKKVRRTSSLALSLRRATDVAGRRRLAECWRGKPLTFRNAVSYQASEH